MPEGHEVQKDQIIAEIDHRSYKTPLEKAMAQREANAALLQSASQDLARYADLAKRNFAWIQQVND